MDGVCCLFGWHICWIIVYLHLKRWQISHHYDQSIGHTKNKYQYSHWILCHRNFELAGVSPIDDALNACRTFTIWLHFHEAEPFLEFRPDHSFIRALNGTIWWKANKCRVQTSNNNYKIFSIADNPWRELRIGNPARGRHRDESLVVRISLFGSVVAKIFIPHGNKLTSWFLFADSKTTAQSAKLRISLDLTYMES